MESNSASKTTHDDFPHGKEKKKPTIPLRELVMEALLSASSGGMAVSEIYEFVNSRCKEYDLAENKWKINVRNMLTTSVYFHCFPRKKRDGRRGRSWKFNIDAYNLHLQMKGNRGPSDSTPNEDNRRDFIGSIGEIIPPAAPASFNNFNANVVAFKSSQTGSQPTEPNRIYPTVPTHQDNAWSSDMITGIRPQQVQMSSMLNQYASHPFHLQETHYSNGTDFRNTVSANAVDQFQHHNVQQAHFSCDYVKTVRRNYVNRFLPYDVRGSRIFTHLANKNATPGHKQDTSNYQQHSVQHSSQSYSLASINSDSSWMVQAYPQIDAGGSYVPENLYSQTQLKSADPYHHGMS